MPTIYKLFSQGLKENYKVLDPKNANTVYLCTDTRELFVGQLLFSGGFRTYTDTLPASPATDVLYYNETTGIGSYYTGSAWKIALKPTVNEINDTATNDSVPTAKAVKDYVDLGVTKATKSPSVVSSITSKDKENGTLQITKGDGSTAETKLKGVAHDIAYDTTNLKLTIPVVGGKDIVVNLPQDNFVESGGYNTATKSIDLTLKDKTIVSIPAASLIDVYTSGSGASDTVTIAVSSDNKITATFKVDTGSALGITADGKLTIDLSAYASVTYVNGLNTAMDSRVTATETAISVLNRNSSTNGSVAKVLADAKAYANGLDNTMKERVSAVEDALTMGTFQLNAGGF